MIRPLTKNQKLIGILCGRYSWRLKNSEIIKPRIVFSKQRKILPDRNEYRFTAKKTGEDQFWIVIVDGIHPIQF